ncbi:MAG: hypothetical protein Q4F05_12220 [bacterium]|nr:hypothetical protein [bacterium]
MENIKTIKVLTVLIVALAGIAALIGLFSSGAKEYDDIKTAFGETIKLYNKGLYARDSVSMATQAIAQDFITLVIGIPLVTLSLCLLHNRKAVGAFLLTGTIAYFLYTYMSYSFLITYNPLYLIYVAIMTLSLYDFILCMKAILQGGLCKRLEKQFPVKLISRFLIITGLVLGMMWLGRIVPTITTNTAPAGLEHYSTLGIQTLDLGVVVPACFVSGYLLKKKKEWGYLLAVVLVCKAVTMTAAVSAMAILMRIRGVEMKPLELIVFPVLFVTCTYCSLKLFKR